MTAYAETYLPRAMRNLGEAVDYAVFCGFAPDDFMARFIVSGLASEWEGGAPRVLAGLSGTELVRDVYETTGFRREWPAPQQAFDCSSSYWTGWVLAYYQWKTARSFREIARYLRFSDIEAVYSPLHEASEDKFVDWAEEAAARSSGESVLKRLRTLRGLTQKELAERTGVNLRSIRDYEQRPGSLDKAEAETVRRLMSAVGALH